MSDKCNPRPTPETIEHIRLIYPPDNNYAVRVLLDEIEALRQENALLASAKSLIDEIEAHKRDIKAQKAAAHKQYRLEWAREIQADLARQSTPTWKGPLARVKSFFSC